MAAGDVLITRRALSAMLGTAVLVPGIAACSRQGKASSSGDAGRADGPGVWVKGTHRGPTEFGFLTSGPPHSSAEQFGQDLETLLQLGMTWVRIAVVADTVVEAWGFGSGEVRLKEDVLDEIAQAAAHAQSLGLKVYLVVADIYDSPSADEAEFLRNMRQFWAGIARPLVGHVDVWQIFNEPDGAHFRTLKDVPSRQRPAYLRQVARALAAAHEELERIDPSVSMTTNLYGYPLDDAMEKRWRQSFDVFSPYLDLLTVDAYPELSEVEARELPHRLERLRDRYDKEVIVGEMGLQTCTHCATEEQQANAYKMYIDVYSGSSIPVVLFYQLHDDGTDTGEGTFGIEGADGRKKPAFAVIEDQMSH